MHPANWSSDTLLAQGYKEGVMPGSYIVAGARTPIGKMSGALADFSAADLGGFAIAEFLPRNHAFTNVDTTVVNHLGFVYLFACRLFEYLLCPEHQNKNILSFRLKLIVQFLYINASNS